MNKIWRFMKAMLCCVPFIGFIGGTAALAQTAPRITGFEVQQVPRLAPGTELNFTVHGTPAARAVLRIDGVARTLTLDETRAGLYQGTYVISNRDSLRADTNVSVTLTANNQNATAMLEPVLVQGARPRPAQARIEFFDIQPVAELRGGYEIPFTVVGSPGGQASVSLQGVSNRIVLDETKPGEYTGSYTIRNSDRLSATTTATATLRVGDRTATQPLGRSLLASAAAPLTGGSAVARSGGCDVCGVVEAVRTHEEKSKDNTLGTVAGGVAGALLGSQVGSGRGRTAAEIAGAVGGAYAGNRIQANMGKTVHYEVVVRMQNGTTQSVNFEKDPGFKGGDRVRLVNGTLQREQ